MNENSAKASLGKLSVSQNSDPLVKETKSLGRLSVSQNSDPLLKETKTLGRLSVSQNSEPAKESKVLSCMLFYFFLVYEDFRFFLSFNFLSSFFLFSPLLQYLLKLYA